MVELVYYTKMQTKVMERFSLHMGLWLDRINNTFYLHRAIVQGVTVSSCPEKGDFHREMSGNVSHYAVLPHHRMLD